MAKRCTVCDSEFKVYNVDGLYYCNKHYLQIRRSGKVHRTKYDPNEIRVLDTHAEVSLYDRFGIEKCRALVSLDKVELIKNIKWYLNHYGYVISKNKEGSVVWMHRLITSASDDFEVDHINWIRHDNRNENLRIASRSNNGMNKLEPKNNTSGHRGVVWHKASGKWISRIKVRGKEIHLGLFSDFKEAVNSRTEAEKELFGEFAPREDDID
ncbi:HNH endonuclease [Brevibacillus brevis]|uniref:HNH endonuclease n=1 Tax=Brevibacillus brevis TaxID=1393 RepID=UPI0007D8B13C|nr:HNH endonuclease [Brevibacillus brevis]